MSIEIEDKNGTELIEAVSIKTGIEADVVKAVYEGTREIIIDCVKDDKKSYIHKFISFFPKFIKGRSGVSPNGTPWTSEDITIVGVKMSDTVKRDLNA